MAYIHKYSHDTGKSKTGENLSHYKWYLEVLNKKISIFTYMGLPIYIKLWQVWDGL